jgi:hypothetical protein
LFDLATLSSVSELTSEHAKQAASSSTGIRTLLKRVAEIAKPGEGCPKIMMAIARLVGQPWVEGDLRIELSGDETSTTMNVMCDYGVGIRERLLPLTRFAVPIDEFERALELAPKLVLPLRITDEAGKLVLTPLAMPESRVHSIAPPKPDVGDESLGDGERKTAPPPPDELQVVDEAMPDELEPADLTKPAATKPPPALEAADDGWADEPQRISGEVVGVGAGGGEAMAAREQAVEHAGRMESGRVPTASNEETAGSDRRPNVHTRPTVRRMVAIDAAAIAAVKRRDPRREEE